MTVDCCFHLMIALVKFGKNCSFCIKIVFKVNIRALLYLKDMMILGFCYIQAQKGHLHHKVSKSQHRGYRIHRARATIP